MDLLLIMQYTAEIRITVYDVAIVSFKILAKNSQIPNLLSFCIYIIIFTYTVKETFCICDEIDLSSNFLCPWTFNISERF